MSCLGIRDSSRKYVDSTCRCLESELTENDCPADYKSFGDIRETGVRCGCTWGSTADQAKCYKTTYPTDQASRLKCCTGETAEKDCDPQYCVKNWANCAPIFKKECSTDLTKPVCARLITGNLATPNSKTLYNEMAQEYCKGVNLNQGVCREWCKKNLGKCKDSLRTFCKDKAGNLTYSSTCACYFPQEKYQAIATKIANEWDVPDNYIDPTPECMFPACKASDYVDEAKKNKCTGLTIAKCYQNIDINLEDSSVPNLIVNQNVTGCKTAFSKKKKPGTSGAPPADDPPADDKVPSDEMDDTTKIILTIIVIVLASLGLYWMFSDDDDDDQMMFVDDQYQSESYRNYY